jgi:hypothetical protein
LWSCVPVIKINRVLACTVGTNKHSHPTPNYGAAAVNRYIY